MSQIVLLFVVNYQCERGRIILNVFHVNLHERDNRKENKSAKSNSEESYFRCRKICLKPGIC